MSRKRAREEPCFICSHWHNYEAGEPCSVCGHGPAAESAVSHGTPIPTEVVRDFLFLGSYDQASRSELLRAMGIKRILNTVPESVNLFRNTFLYHTASGAAGAPKWVPFEECFAFLDEAHAAGEKVLVHCMSGSSRSPSLVIAYLMRTHRMRLAHAHAWLVERRPSVALQPAAAAQLSAFEHALLGEAAHVPAGPPGFNPLPQNDCPFGVLATPQNVGPLRLPEPPVNAQWQGAGR